MHENMQSKLHFIKKQEIVLRQKKIISETEKYDFDEKRISFCVLDKPEKVIAKDDISSEEIELPEHLTSDEWHFVKIEIDIN